MIEKPIEYMSIYCIYRFLFKFKIIIINVYDL